LGSIALLWLIVEELGLIKTKRRAVHHLWHDTLDDIKNGPTDLVGTNHFYRKSYDVTNHTAPSLDKGFRGFETIDCNFIKEKVPETDNQSQIKWLAPLCVFVAIPTM